MLLERLSEAPGVASKENEIRDIIRDFICDDVEKIRTDIMGNLIAAKGLDKQGPVTMLAAHMDEVGLMITDINENGLLKFMSVGGLDKRILVSKVVRVGCDNITGVIGAKPIHLQKKAERKKPIDIDNLYIDIGVNSQDEAKSFVQPGDVAVFKTEFNKLENNKVIGKAFDDRVGCSLLAKLTKFEPSAPTYFVFTVQEEVGLRGARQAAYKIDPDRAIVLEGTTAADVPNNKEHRYSTTLEEGPAFTIRDRSLISSRSLLQKLIKTAENNNINYQFRRTTAGGNDAGVIHLTRDGVPSAVISLPCRYIHSPLAMMSLEDYSQAENLLKKFICKTN